MRDIIDMLINPVFSVALVTMMACTTGRNAPDSARPTSELSLISRIEYLDTLTREPMLAEHQSGALFVSGYSRGRPNLWKSVDRGAHWKRVNVGSAKDGAVGNSDVDLAIARDGTLYFVNLTYDGEKSEGRQITIGASHDIGATWHWSTLSQNRFDDRPWVVTARDGTAHVIWSDDHGVTHAVSRDGGATWTTTGRIHDRGGSSHMAIGPHDEIAVRIAPGAAGGNKCDVDTDIIAISTDGGATWQKHPAPGLPRQTGCDLGPGAIERWVDPLAWTKEGNLNALWTDSSGVRLSTSRDRGVTWTTWTLLPRSNGKPTSFFPYLTDNGKGGLAGTWFTEPADGLRWHAAFIETRADGAPLIEQSARMTMESRRGEPLHDDPGGEYIPVQFLSDGTLGVITPIQNAAGGRLGFTFWRFRHK